MTTKPAVSKTTTRHKPARAEHLESLERGLRVLQLFGVAGQHELTMAAVAEQIGSTRAAAMRLVGTLERLDFLRTTARGFVLAPRVLALGYAYLASLGFRAVAKPIVEALRTATGETCSMGVLDGGDVVYVARAEARRIIRIDLAVGSRLPAHLNSMGRVMLSALPDRELDRYLATLRPVALTRHTVTSKIELRKRIVAVRRDGYCFISNEVEQGIAGLATPIRDGNGRTVASLNLSLAFSRHTNAEIRRNLLPQLQESTRQIEALVSTDLALA